MTMQTAAPLEPTQLRPYNRTLDHFVSLTERERLDFDPPYQRGDVWGTERRQNLIRSLILGVPIGSIVINSRFNAGWEIIEGRTPFYAIIDGKQRVSAMLAWMRGDLLVPASWFPADDVLETVDTEDGPYVTVDMLRHGVRRWSNQPVPTLEAVVPDLAGEQEIFNLINFGGVAQGDSDLELET